MALQPRTSRSGSVASSVYVALLRGINVGGKNRLAMADLITSFQKAGCTDVQTYIQSGNVVFTADTRTVKRVPQTVADEIAARFGMTLSVILRSAAELRKIAADNPFLDAGIDPERLHVAFLAEKPEPRRAAALDPHRSPGDAFHIRGREMYLHFPNGTAASKLTNSYLDSTLGTISTIRNWRTVLKLLAMTQAAT